MERGTLVAEAEQEHYSVVEKMETEVKLSNMEHVMEETEMENKVEEMAVESVIEEMEMEKIMAETETENIAYSYQNRCNTHQMDGEMILYIL
jgi:hypothetical protein